MNIQQKTITKLMCIFFVIHEEILKALHYSFKLTFIW